MAIVPKILMIKDRFINPKKIINTPQRIKIILYSFFWAENPLIIYKIPKRLNSTL